VVIGHIDEQGSPLAALPEEHVVAQLSSPWMRSDAHADAFGSWLELEFIHEGGDPFERCAMLMRSIDWTAVADDTVT
jgi:hypothetical protein